MPTVTIGENTGNDYAGLWDSQIDSLAPTTNKDTQSDFAIGYGSYRWNTVMRCTGLSNISGTVSDATLYIYRQEGHWSDPTLTVHLREILRNYDRTTVCWDYYTGTTGWTAGGALSDNNDIDDSDLASLSIASVNGYKGFSSSALTTYVNAVVNATKNNYGINLVNYDADSQYHVFTSSEGTDSRRPYLSVTYTSGGANGYYYMRNQ